MISENPRILDLKIEYLENFTSLFPVAFQKKILFILYKGNEIIKSVILPDIRIKIRQKFTPSTNILQELKEEFKLDYTIAIEKDAIKKITSDFQRKVHFNENYIRQILCLWSAISYQVGKRIFEYPPILQKFKYLRYFLIEKIFKLIMPQDGSIIFVIFSENRIFASFILEIVGGEIDLITTGEFIDDEKIKIKKWQTDYKIFLKKAMHRIKKPFIGIFLEKDTLRKIKDIKSLKDAIVSRKIILDPAPAKVLLPLHLILFPT